eukprot:TRINITY_DN7386_c0_g1_i2.p1 TRINITY_DN7386_c0_g1~~TRINITY_DN7386_c0_g1_i2.p1  ORF type:complete len:368 (-),score=58.33 TRINITY_DN7386_c0_g1_i2:9-1112(-)
MWELYSELNPEKPQVLETLRVWQRALENCSVYLGQLETTLSDIMNLEREVLEIFKLDTKEERRVKEVRFTPKALCGALDIAFKYQVKEVGKKTVDEIRQLANCIFLYYDLEKVDYVEAPIVCCTVQEVRMNLKKEILFSSKITKLTLDNLNIGDEGAKIIFEALKESNTLKTLSLEYNNIGVKGSHFIREALEMNTSVTLVGLKGNNLGPEGAGVISEALKVNNTLSTLYLAENKIGDKGLKHISEALKVNKTLTSLGLYCNEIGVQGAQFISEALTVNNSLQNLTMGSNYVEEQGSKFLAKALTVNQTLTGLNLYDNHIGNAGSISILSALQLNKTLITLDLRIIENGISSATEGALLAAWRQLLL